VVVSMNPDFSTNGWPRSLLRSISTDNGATWATGIIADGVNYKEEDGTTLMLKGYSDPSMAYDSFGNLFLAYNGQPTNGSATKVALYVSTNHGDTFSRVTSFPYTTTGTDLPRLTSGPSGPSSTNAALWVSFFDGMYGSRVCGTLVSGLGTSGISSNWINVSLTNLNGGSSKLTGIAVGPNGETLVSYVNLYTESNGAPPRTLYSALDADGLGTNYTFAATTNFTLDWGWEPIQAVGCSSGNAIVPIPSLAWDRVSNRVYVAYHSRPTTCPSSDSHCTNCPVDTDIFVRVGVGPNFIWGDPIRVNAVTNKNQFFPRIAVDDQTGATIVTWYDCRNSGSNSRAQLFGAVSRDGFSIAPTNFQINPISSDGTTGFTLGFWDYTGMTFYKGWAYPAWQDNSNSTANNPDGSCCTNKFDLYISRIPY
jgi:hypothetical protein